MINRDKLADSIVMLKRVGGSHVPDFPTQRVPSPVASALSCLLKDETPNCDDFTEDDMSTLIKIIKLCRCSDILLKCKRLNKTEEDKEMDRFDILRGEIQAGNDNKSLIKEFKLMLIRFMNSGRIPRRQAHEILTDIASMGV